MDPLGEQVVRIFLAAALSSFIGIEREKSHKPAGLRTHVLVSIASCLSSLIAVYYYPQFVGQILAAVITGIGFLGAGSIIFGHRNVHGLTTAASIWLVAILGIAVGVGAYFLSVVFTLISLLFLRIKKIERKL